MKAVDRVRPQLRKQGCEVELLRCTKVRSGCEWNRRPYAAALPQKTCKQRGGRIYERAPDLSLAGFIGLEEKPASGFVPWKA